MTDKKVYYITSQQGNQTLTAEEYEQQKDSIYKDNPLAVVQEVGQYNEGDEIDDNDKFYLSRPNYAETMELSAQQFRAAYDKIKANYPDAKIARGRTIRDLSSSMQDYNRLQSEIDEYDKAIAADTTSLEETAATQGVGQGEGLAHALDRWKARKAIDDKTKKRDALAAERDNNDYYRAIKESISATNKSDAERVGSQLSQIEADNKGIQLTKMPMGMGGLGKMPVSPAQWEEASPVVADYHALTLARKAYDEAQEILDAPSKHDGSSNWRGYWQALAKGLPDALLAKDDFNTALQGVMIKAISKAQEGAEEGVELNFFELAADPERMSQLGLSAAEQELIKAITNKTQIEAMYSSDISAGYQAGQSAAESLPFMRDFILTSGIGSAVGKAITKPLIKKTAEAGLKGIARTGAKLGINTLDATITTVLRTPLMASSWNNFTDQMTQIDSEGKVDMSGEKILKTAGDIFIENLSEMSGRGLSAAGKAVGKAVKPLTKGIAKTKFGEAAKALYNPQVKSWVETAGFNGIFEELGEEWYGNALRTITGVDPNALQNFADLEQQLITLASFGLMTGVSAGTSLAMRGAANLDYEQKKKAFVDYFSKAGYDEETINNILDINAYETPEDLSKGVTPVLKQLAQDNRLDENAIKVAADLVKATARLKGTQANLEVDLEERRNNAEQELLARLNPEGGEANTYLFSDNRREGDTTPTGRVRVIDKGNKRGYLTTRDEDGVYTIEYTDGTKGFISEAQLQEQNGKTLNDSGWLTRNEYLDQELAALKLDAEQRRIREEGQVAQNLLSRSTQVGQRVNLNTEEAPIYGTILSHTPSGYVVETEDGQAREVSKQEMANHLGISLQGETDAARELREGVEQLAREQSIRRVNDSKGIKINGQEIVKVLNVRKDESGRWIADAVLADDSGSIVVAYDDVIKGYIESLPVVAEEQQRVDAANAEVEAKMLQEKDGIQRDFRGNPLPLLDNGSVDQTALWNADPEAWAKWNDSRNNDNGADSINYITAAVNTLANEIAADSQAANAEMQFDVRDTLKAAVAQKQARLETLNGILNGYAQEAEARERANAEKRSVRGILESENNVAPMSVEEAEALDADYNNRYAPAKTLSERTNILGEYLGVISNGSIPAVVVTSQNYQQVMTERGCSEANIAKVKEQMDAGLIVDGFTTNGAIYLMVDGINSLEEARVTYVHERQHLVNSAYAGTENDRVAELASLGREELLASLAKVCDKAALKTYASLSDKGIADELICRLIERVYTNEDYLVTLGNEGISENVLSIIKTIDNEQRENTNLSNARRGSRRTENESEALGSGVAEDERNLGEVSNGVLGEEAVGSAEDSERGVADSSQLNARQTVIELYNDEELTEEEIEDYINANLKKAQSDLDKHAAKAPKMGTDIAKYKEAKAKYAQDTAELEKKRDFWKEVQSYIAIPAIELDMEPQNALELAARELTRNDEFGIKLLYNSLKRHTGWGTAEMGSFLPILRSQKNGGVSLEEAGEKLELADRELGLNFLDQDDPNAGLNTILELLSGARTSKDLSSYIKANREQAAKEAAEYARNAMIEELAAEAAPATTNENAEQEVLEDLPFRVEGSDNEDIRFRTANGSLVGMHNISEDKLRKAIKLGGLANPSAAVINIAEYLHDGYGEISLIMPSSLVDSETGDNVGTYTGDAWTPTYPSISRKIDDSGWKMIKDRIRAAVGEESELYSDIVLGVDNYLDGNYRSKMEFVFLKERGIEPEIAYKGADGLVGMRNLEAILGVQSLRDGMESYERYKNASPMAKRSFNIWLAAAGNKQAHRKLKEQLKKEPKLAEVLKLNEDVSFADFDSFTYNIFRKEQDAGNVDTYDTLGAAARYVDANNLRGEFDAWLESLMEQAGAKEVFFAGYTRSGERIYKDNTLENVSRHMKMQGRTNAYDDHGLSATKSALLQRMTSLAQIRKNKARLQNESAYNKEYDALKDRLFKIISQLADMQEISDNKFMNIDYAESRLQEAITKRSPIAHLKKEYGYDIDPQGEFAQEVKSFIADVQKMPAKYFETKFERPVYLNEFAAAVMPNNTSEDVKQAITEAGLPIFEYDSDVEGARREATLKATEEEGVRFRILGELGAANLDAAEEATTRLDNLDVARQMEEAGKDAKTIRLATGWERGADKLWKYEVPDEYDLANLEKRLQEELDNGAAKTWGIVYPSDLGQLLKEYPDFNVDIMVWVGKEFENNGAYSPATEGDENTFGRSASIEVEAKTIADIAPILAHEIQHAIQEIEGFAEGGQVRGLKDKLSAELDKRVATIKQLREEGRNEEADELLQMSKGLAYAVINNEDDAYGNYKKLAGEVEARNAATRIGKSIQERRESLLSETEDVAREDQIILMESLGRKNMIGTIANVPTYDAVEGTEFGDWLKFVDTNTIAKGKTQFYIANTGPILNKYGINGKINVSRKAINPKKHTPNADHVLGVQEWIDVVDTINDPIYITRYNGSTNSYRIYTIAKVNGKNICVGVDVNTANGVEITKIKTAFGRDINLIKSSKTETVIYDKKKAAKLISGSDNSHLYAKRPSVDKGSNNLGENNTRFRVTPEKDKAYMDAVEAGDMEAAQRMVLEAAKLAMPNTKVVDEDGNPLVVYHGTAMEENVFKDQQRSRGFWFTDREEVANGYAESASAELNGERRIIPAFLNIENPRIEDAYGKYPVEIALKSYVENDNGVYQEFETYEDAEAYRKENVPDGWVGASEVGDQDDLVERAIELGYDGVIVKNVHDQATYAETRVVGTQTNYIAISPSQIKSAEPVTYDNKGNVIPLSERFNPENDDIRFRLSNENQAIFVSNAARAVEGIKMEKATPEQWLKMIEKGGGLKAGEDKWMGLSDWLKASDKKTLTKAEVLDFINENMIIIEEQHYEEDAPDAEALWYKYEESEEGVDEINYQMQLDAENYAKQALDGRGLTDEEWEEEYDRLVYDYIEDDLFGSALSAAKDAVRERWMEEEAPKIMEGRPREINTVRLEYTTNGLVNLHEIALTIPTIESWNERDNIHFGDAGDGRVVAWIRFGDAKKLLSTMETKVVEEFEEPYKNFNGNDVYKPKGEKSSKDYVVNRSIKDGRAGYIVYINDTVIPQLHSTLEEARVAMNEYYAEHPRKKFVNERVLVIDEIQSKRHQEGREKGYRVANINKWLKDNNVEVVETGEFFEFIKDGKTDRRFSKGLMQYDIEKAKRLYVSGYVKSDIPDAPFDKNWHELAMKRMLRYAAENGYDVVAWTKGEQQNQRYGLSKVVDEIYVASDFASTKSEESSFRMILKNGNDNHVGVNKKTGVVTFYNENPQAIGKPLSDLLGKEMADKILAAKDYQTFRGVDFELSEGMKGFYDKMLPAFVNKYGKKWGIKVEDIELPNLEDGLTMHSVPVTEEMKASVMEGQVMFRTTAFNEGRDADNVFDALANAFDGNYGKASRLIDELESYFGGEIVEVSAGAYRAMPELVPYPASKYQGEDAEYHHIRFKRADGETFVEAVPFVLPEKAETLFRTSSSTEYDPNEGILDTVRRINVQNELDVDGVRYRAVTDQETIDWLESGEKYLFYRNVVLFPDGTFGSPMASKLTNKGAAKIKTSGFALNEWEMAEEHPELVKNGKIRIVKPNGKPLDVDYNPYVHSRPNRVNTQFKQAWERPDLIYIETEVSSSDIDEKYHAPEAARPIGLDQDWNGGKLTLSRYDKPVRMVPWAEVADDWMEHFGKKGIHFDIIPPSLLPILAERGAKIVAPHKNMGKECFDAYDAWKANPNEYYASLEIPENVRVLSEDNGVRFKIDSTRHEGESDYDYTRRMVSALYKEYKSDASVGTVSWDGGDSSGYYDPKKKLIVIYTKKDAKFADIEDTYFHEQVHHALTKLPKEARSLGYRFLAKFAPDVLKDRVDELSENYKENEIEEEVTAWHIADDCVKGNAATMLSLISGKGKHYLSEILKSFNYDPIREFNARGGESIGEVEGELAGQRLPQDSRPTNDAGRDGRGVGEDDERSDYDDTSTNGGIDFRTRAFEDEVEASVDLLDTHAIVRENGLAAVLGNAEYNNFIDSLYADANREVRGRIVGYAADHGYNFRNAIARTLANLIAADEQPEFVQTAVDALQQRLGEMPINDAKWMLYLDGTKGGNALDEIRRAQMAHRLGFDTYSIQAKRDLAEDFRLRVSGDMQNRSAIEMYLSSFTPETALIESHADMYVSVENLLQAIEKSSGSKRATFEDVMLALNQLSSKNFSEKDKYQRDFLDPMWDTINAIISFGRKSLDDVVKYVMLKHGLERNEIMAKDEARSHYLSEYNAKVREIKADESTSEDEKNALIANAKAEYDAHIANVDAGADAIYAENRKSDYSGLMAQFYEQMPVERRKDESRQSFLSRKRAARVPKFKTLAEAEAEARRLIDKFEFDSKVFDDEVKNFNEKAKKRNGFTLEEGKDHSLTDMLWERINAATKETLRHQLASGMISKKVYDSIANKYQFYVPLRGFKEEEASDLYHYMNQKGDGGFTAPILKAKGRRSLADNPFGMIGSMAESAIQADNKNLAKQKLYYFLSNRPDNGLAEVRDVWYEDTGLVENGKKVFRKRYPDIKEGMTQEEINKAIQDLEDEMKQKKASGVRVVKKKKNLDLQDSVVKIDSNEQAEHIIKVNVLGEEQIIIINANPRAAQAINGKLNIEADRTFLVRALMAHTRLMSALATSLYPAFVVGNLLRDLQFAQVSTFVEHETGFTIKMNAKILRLMMNGNIFRLVNKQGGGKGLNIDKTDPDLVAAYDEYVMNGGPTGYTYLTNNAEYDKKMKQYLKRQTSPKAIKAVLNFWERFKDTMEAVEQISRFAAYLTAKEEGMSIPEAINASKEVTLNFNRKGSGKYIGWEEADQFVTSENPIIRTLQKMMITSCSLFAGAKLVTMFYNATVQGISKFIKLFKKSAPKMTAVCIGMTMLGMFNAMMHLLWKNDGDDDEKEDEVDDYFNIPTYKRRSSLCLGTGKENRYISIPLPQELVPFYSLGDMIVTSMIPSTKIYPNSEPIKELAITFGELLPFNIVSVVTDEEGLTHGVVDMIGRSVSAFSTPYSLMENETFYGGSIHPENKYEDEAVAEELAHFNQKREKTAPIYQTIAEGINKATGGDDVKGGIINPYPDDIKFVLGDIIGGAGKFWVQVFDTARNTIKGEETLTEDIPILNRVMVDTMEKNRDSYYHDIDSWLRYEELPLLKEMDERLKENYLQSNPDILAEIEDLEAKKKALGSKRDKASVAARRKLTTQINTLSNPDPAAYAGKYLNDPRFKVWWELKDSLDSKFLTKEIAEIDKRLKAATNTEQQELLKAEKWRLQKRFVEDYRRLLNSYEKQ